MGKTRSAQGLRIAPMSPPATANPMFSSHSMLRRMTSSVRALEFEGRVIELLRSVVEGRPVEDESVELKAAWPDESRAARRLAGHANAARAESITWVIGADEQARTVPGVDYTEFSTWWEVVQQRFVELPPTLEHHLNVPFEGKTVTALLVDTTRAPFLVRNPAFGSVKGEAVEHEVPWRDGTKVRTASRSDLITLLSPLVKVPEFEVMEASLNAREQSDEQKGESLFWDLEMTLYALAPFDQRILIPFHHCRAYLDIAGERVALTSVTMEHPTRFESYPTQASGSRSLLALSSGGRRLRHSATIEATENEVLIEGSGRIDFRATGESPLLTGEPEEGWTVEAVVEMRPYGADRPAVVSQGLVRALGGDGHNWVRPRRHRRG